MFEIQLKNETFIFIIFLNRKNKYFISGIQKIKNSKAHNFLNSNCL